MDDHDEGDQSTSRASPETKPKRVTACLHCRRQKLKCDAARVRPCTRCRGEGIECIVRPRANAAILTDDLRWQQSVEARFQSIQGEINQIRSLVGPGGGGGTAGGGGGGGAGGGISGPSSASTLTLSGQNGYPGSASQAAPPPHMHMHMHQLPPLHTHTHAPPPPHPQAHAPPHTQGQPGLSPYGGGGGQHTPGAGAGAPPGRRESGLLPQHPPQPSQQQQQQGQQQHPTPTSASTTTSLSYAPPSYPQPGHPAHAHAHGYDMHPSLAPSAPHLPDPEWAAGGAPTSLLAALARPLALMQGDRPVGVTAEEAVGLWEYFYTTLAIFHGFYSGSSIASPSPLLLTSIACAACSRSMSGEARARLPLWLELFDRAVMHQLAQPGPATWDDTVGLCIAQTWFWSPNASKAGLIGGCFFDTLSPITADVRSRRVWDFVQITILSRSILHLTPTLLPERPPPGVPERVYPHVLFGALTELFDILALLPRALEFGTGLVPLFLNTLRAPGKAWTYTEVSFLRQTLDQVHRWASKWLNAIEMTSRENLPADWTRDFLLEIVNIYYRASTLIVAGYLDQQGGEEYSPLPSAARDYLRMVHDGWSSRLQCWPLLLLHVTILASLALGPRDDLVISIYNRLLETETFLDHTGRQLLRALRHQHQSTPSQTTVGMPMGADTLAAAMGPAGSDAFWDDLMGMFHAGSEGEATGRPM